MFDNIYEIKQRARIEDVLNYYGIKKIKNNYVCPFHSDKSPSMGVKHNRYRCFACGASGDAIDFISNYTGISTNEAINVLCDMYNIVEDKKLSYLDRLRLENARLDREISKGLKQLQLKILDRQYTEKCKEYLRLDMLLEYLAPVKQGGLTDEYGRILAEWQMVQHWIDEYDRERERIENDKG